MRLNIVWSEETRNGQFRAELQMPVWRTLGLNAHTDESPVL